MNDNTQTNDDVTIEPEEGAPKKKKGSGVSDMAADLADDSVSDIILDNESEPTDQVKKLREKLKKCIEEKQGYLDSWQRERAQIANLRKQDEKDKKEFVKFAKEEVVNDLLPVLDSFERAMANKEVWEKIDKNWRVGIEYIHSQLKQTLESHGLSEINPLGKTFDPMRDEAIEYVPVEDSKDEHKILQVLQKGYNLNNKQIRAPKVTVGEMKTEK